MDPASVAIATAAGTAAVAYLDAKYHLHKDLRALAVLAMGDRLASKAAAEKRQSVFYLFEATAQKYPTARAIWSRSGSYTFAETYHRAMQYANWLLSLGVQPKQAVGLYSPNTPEFVFVVLACWAIGSFPAMINYNLGDASLIHCVSVARASILLVEAGSASDPALLSRIEAATSTLVERGVQPVLLTDDVKRDIAARFPDTRPPDSAREHVVGTFPLSLIYTSGTTGLPKAFPFQTQRMYADGSRFAWGMNQVVSESEREVWYDCMPLYHGTGFVVGFAAMINGMTLALGSKFSVSNFWRDVHDSGATGFIYVGETARYLLAAPAGPLDRDHKLRLMYGNGMRPDVWDRFQQRFNVPEIVEFFSSTEGMFGTAVYDRSGFFAKAVGHHGAILRFLLRNTYVPVALDRNTNDMWRDPATGFARRLPYDQGGEILVRVPGRAAWPGYFNNNEGTNKKFVADVFQKGDLFYRPGDALRRNADGLWFFMDRLGDTFRWKGENVSTAEVQDVMGAFPGLGEANVYGVQVPGSEGRAGCAAVVFDAAAGAKAEAFDWKGLAAFLRQKLPRYAVPVFVRVVDADAQAMGTHNNKQNKVLLREEGADPAKTGSKVPHGQNDKLFWLRPGSDAYVPFGSSEWDSIVAGTAKL